MYCFVVSYFIAVWYTDVNKIYELNNHYDQYLDYTQHFFYVKYIYSNGKEIIINHDRVVVLIYILIRLLIGTRKVIKNKKW